MDSCICVHHEEYAYAFMLIFIIFSIFVLCPAYHSPQDRDGNDEIVEIIIICNDDDDTGLSSYRHTIILHLNRIVHHFLLKC